jgi:hypothetical protein
MLLPPCKQPLPTVNESGAEYEGSSVCTGGVI